VLTRWPWRRLESLPGANGGHRWSGEKSRDSHDEAHDEHDPQTLLNEPDNGVEGDGRRYRHATMSFG
jgi:hypothetical protein